MHENTSGTRPVEAATATVQAACSCGHIATSRAPGKNSPAHHALTVGDFAANSPAAAACLLRLSPCITQNYMIQHHAHASGHQLKNGRQFIYYDVLYQACDVGLAVHYVLCIGCCGMIKRSS